MHSHDGRRELWSVTVLGRHATSSPVLGTRATQLLGVLYAGPNSTSRLAEQTGASAHSVLHGIAALREHYLCEPPPGAAGRRPSIWGGSERVWQLTQPGYAAALPGELAAAPAPGRAAARGRLFS